MQSINRATPDWCNPLACLIFRVAAVSTLANSLSCTATPHGAPSFAVQSALTSASRKNPLFHIGGASKRAGDGLFVQSRRAFPTPKRTQKPLRRHCGKQQPCMQSASTCCATARTDLSGPSCFLVLASSSLVANFACKKQFLNARFGASNV